MFLWCPPAETLDEALVWENAEEAHDWLDLHAPAERVVLQYVATVRADIEQRLAAAYHEHTWR
jgi:hypothetical protein